MFEKYFSQDTDDIVKAIGTGFFIATELNGNAHFYKNNADNVNTVFDMATGKNGTFFYVNYETTEFTIVGHDNGSETVYRIIPCKNNALSCVVEAIGGNFADITVYYENCDFEDYTQDTIKNTHVADIATVETVEKYNGVYEITATVTMTDK